MKFDDVFCMAIGIILSVWGAYAIHGSNWASLIVPVVLLVVGLFLACMGLCYAVSSWYWRGVNRQNAAKIRDAARRSAHG